jgi:hypothetical protein
VTGRPDRTDALDEVRRDAMLADSYSRIQVLIDALRLPRSEWFKLLGEEWTGLDNLWSARSILRAELRAADRADLDLMMSERERAALAALPERITVYRGCYRVNRAGLSWSIDRSVAARFPHLMRYRRDGEQAILRIGTAWRDEVVLKLDRDEHEIIAPLVFGIREEALQRAMSP